MSVAKRPSLSTVAQAAGVSTSTVSRVASGDLRVAPEIRDHVRAVARKCGLDLDKRRNEKSTIVAFLLSNRDLLHSFQSHILLGAESFCASQNRELLFMSMRYSPSVPTREIHLPQILRQRKLVGAVILGGTNSANMLAALREREIPFAVLGNNVVGEWDPAEYNAVFSDDIQGAFDVTRHLIGEGHQHIHYIGDVDLPWYARCAQGYRKAMTESGLQPRFSEIRSDDRQLGYLATRAILSKGEPLSALFAGSDQIARGVYEALRQSGLKIPDDVSVVGFNDSEGALMDPPLTSVAEFPEELGKHLAAFVLSSVQDPQAAPQQLNIPTRVIVRSSTRRAPGLAAEIGPETRAGIAESKAI